VSAVSSSRTRVQTFDYDSNNYNSLETSTQAATNSFDLNCASITATEHKDFTTLYTFDPIGNIQTIDGPRPDASDVTNYTFDPHATAPGDRWTRCAHAALHHGAKDG
jgi:hypothetical protein